MATQYFKRNLLLNLYREEKKYHVCFLLTLKGDKNVWHLQAISSVWRPLDFLPVTLSLSLAILKVFLLVIMLECTRSIPCENEGLITRFEREGCWPQAWTLTTFSGRQHQITDLGGKVKIHPSYLNPGQLWWSAQPVSYITAQLLLCRLLPSPSLVFILRSSPNKTASISKLVSLLSLSCIQ